jgi:prepilin-type N-terminal cleavage/methylation domain-containing protein
MRLSRSRRCVPRNPAAGRAGFTLLEVLFAVAILGMGTAIIVQALGVGLRVRRESMQMREMTLVASGALDRLLLEGEAPVAEEEGEEGKYTWRHMPDGPFTDEEGDERGLTVVRVLVERPSGSPLEVVTLLPTGEDP